MLAKKTVTMALVVALCSALVTGCGGSDGGEGGENRFREEIVIGWTPPDITGVFQTATNYFEQSAEEANKAGFDVRIETRSPATHTSYSDQIGIIEDFIAQDVDAIAVSPASVETIKPAIQQANQADIPVIVVNLLEKQDDVEVASYVGFDNSVAAEVTAYSVLDYYGGPGVLGEGEQVDVGPDEELDIGWWRKVYEDADLGNVDASGTVIEGIAGDLFSNERVNGFTGVMDEYGTMELLGNPIAANWDREEGVSAAENFLSRYGAEEMDFMWGASSEMALGAATAVQREGVLDTSGGGTPPEEGSVGIFSNDVTPESTEAIRNGELVAETDHGFAEWGWIGTKLGVQLACGQQVPEQYDIGPSTVWEGNADRFYPDPTLPQIDWQEIRSDC